LKIKCESCGKLFDTLPQWEEHRDSTFACHRASFDLEVEPTDNLPKVDPTPSLPDECMKLLDNGWRIVLFKNGLGSYTAKAIKQVNDEGPLFETQTRKVVITDDFTPSKALYRLTEKTVTGRIV
jgi:hypothetical protein